MADRRAPHPGVLALVIATAGPVLLALVFMAIYASGGIGLLSHGWTMRNWNAVLGDAATWVSLGYSALVGLASLVVPVVVALGVAAALGSHVRRGPLRWLLYVPLAIPGLVAALLSMQVIGRTGWLSRLAHALGLVATPNAFPTLLYTASGIGIVLTYTALVAPFLVLLFDRLSRNERLASMLQLARSLGASSLQGWLRVGVPVLLRAATPVLSVYLIVLVGAFEVPLMVGAQYPSMISVLIRQRFALFDISTRPQAYALACVYAVLAITALLALFAWRRRRQMHERGG